MEHHKKNKKIHSDNPMLAGKNLINQHKTIKTPEPFNATKFKRIPHPLNGIDPRFKTAYKEVAI